MKYDAIIVGARVAGASLALLLAKQGRKVLIIDRFATTTDTLSTHFIWPRGVTHLKRLGVLDELLAVTPSSSSVTLQFEDILMEGSVNAGHLKNRFAAIGLPEEDVETKTMCVRRTVLDTLLLKKAREAGATFLGNRTLVNLIREGETVRGVELLDENSQREVHYSDVVVGADGKHSTVARLVGAQKREVRPNGTFAFYTYFEGPAPKQAIIARRSRLGMGAVPTNDGKTMVLVYGPQSFGKDFVADLPNHFSQVLEFVTPHFFRDFFLKAKQVEKFYGTLEQEAFLRTSSGPGFCLIGDAASFKDQCTASGITHALRDAELAAKHLEAAYRGEISFEHALRDYSEVRFLDSYKYFEFVAAQADMNPFKADDLELLSATRNNVEQIELLLGVFSDTLPPKAYFGMKNRERTIGTKRPPQIPTPMERYLNPFRIDESLSDLQPLIQNCGDYAQTVGPSIEKRVNRYGEWAKKRQEAGTWQYSRTLDRFPGPRTVLRDTENRKIDGINFASQDYLGLGAHPRVKEAAIRALHEFGPHSAGSPMVIGNTALSEKLERELADFLGTKEVVLYPTGWAAGYGVITGLVNPNDHIVMDKLTHSCLQQGAFAATKKIHRHPHLDAAAARALLKKIRERDRRNGILVITEGIFSMDSDAPDLRAMQMACREFDALLVVDVAHDLGALGPGGTGQIGLQGLLGEIDVVMGSFSKSFASNGGFVATKSSAIREYLKMFSSSHLFSNALSPIQTAVVNECLNIIRSPEGDMLRAKLSDVVIHFRSQLESYGLTCLGQMSAIVPVLIGREDEARIAHRQMMAKNIAAMILEYPVVATGQSRFRLQVMATHEKRDANIAARAIHDSMIEVRELLRRRSIKAQVSNHNHAVISTRKKGNGGVATI